MKSCFTSETQENNVSLKSQEFNRETTYVQVVGGDQLQDHSKMSNEKGNGVIDSDKHVFFTKNATEQTVLVSKSSDETLPGVAGKENGALSRGDTGRTQTLDSTNEETSLCPQPEWFINLEEVSRGKVREICKQAGPAPTDTDANLEKLRALFNIDRSQALEVNELYHSGRLKKAPPMRPKSILKGSSSRSIISEAGSTPTITRRLSWIDESGGKLAEKHVMKTWHYMDSRRNKANQCCQIL